MPLTPQDIESRIFDVRKRGYDKTQVDRFLGEVAAALRTAVESGDLGPQPTISPVTGEAPSGSPLPRRRALVDPLTGAEVNVERPPAVGAAGGHQVQGPPLTPTSLGQPPQVQGQTQQPLPYQQLGSEVAAVLASAQQEADALRRDAEAKVARLKADTEEYVRKVQAEGQRYAAGRKEEADHDRREAARALAHAQEQAAAATWAHEEAQRVLATAQQEAQQVLTTAREQADTELDEATHEADRILEQAERAARARVEGILADADRRLEEAASALNAGSGPLSTSPRSERRRPPTSPIRGGRRRTDPPVIDLVRDEDPIIDLVEGSHRPGRAGAEAAAPGHTDEAPMRSRSAADPLATLLSDAMAEPGDEGDGRPGPA